MRGHDAPHLDSVSTRVVAMMRRCHDTGAWPGAGPGPRLDATPGSSGADAAESRDDKRRLCDAMRSTQAPRCQCPCLGKS